MRNVAGTRLSVVAIAVGLLLSTACSTASSPSPGASPPGPQPASTTDQPKRGGTLTLRTGPDSYGGTDPQMGQQSYNVWPVAGELLLRADIENWEIKPAAIERWEYSPDGLTLTLHVRKGMKFHNKPPVDGREVEARDVIYTLKSVTGQQYPSLPSVRFPRKANLEQMTDAVAVDKHTVKVTLSEQSATFLEGLAEYKAATLIPEGLRESFGGPESLVNPSVERVVSAGPFVLTTFTNNVQAEYTRNADYYEKAADGQTKPYLDTVRYIWIPDTATANAAFVAGKTDVGAISNPEDRNLIMGQRKDIQIVSYAPNSCWHRVAFNTTRKPFDDVRVRKAIALMMDPSEFGKQFYGDWEGKPLWKYPGPLPWVFPEAIPQEELAKLPGYRPQKEQDLAEARRLLNEAGHGQGFAFELMFPTSMKDNATLVQQQITRVVPGFKIDLRSVDNAINHQRTADGNFDVQYYCYIHEGSGVAQMKTPYHSKGGRNYSRYSNERMDTLLDQAARELDLAKRTKLLREAQTLALEHMPYVPAMHYATQVALQPYVRQLRYGSATDRQVWFKEVWMAN